MDSALDKIGVYDFFGVFLSGMFVVFISYYLLTLRENVTYCEKVNKQ